MKNKKVQFILLICLVVWALVVCSYIIGVKQSGTPGGGGTQEEKKSGQYDLGYFVLEMPGEYADIIEHTRIEENGVTTNVFDLVHKGFRVELFRIIFGDADQGEYIGLLRKESDKVALCYSVPMHTAEELVHVEVEEYYYKLMDEFNVVFSQFNAIEGIERNVSVDVGNDYAANLTYWNVELPENMSWQENTENGNYRVDFYGTVAERKILLYTIYLGNVDADAVLGTYQVDGIKKAVSVKSYDLKMQEGWTEQDMLTAGTLMDTINDVIQVITSSEHFSAQ